MSGPVVISGILVQPLVREGRPGWRNGRRGALKMRCPRGHAGSSPAPGTIVICLWPAVTIAVSFIWSRSEHGLNTYYSRHTWNGPRRPPQIGPQFGHQPQAITLLGLSLSPSGRRGLHAKG